jgi:hypothetical protein
MFKSYEGRQELRGQTRATRADKSYEGRAGEALSPRATQLARDDGNERDGGSDGKES